MRIVAIFGIDSGPLSTVVALLLLFLVVVYFALIFWTYQDAKRRIADPLLVACATVASMFPFVGTIVYLILRPPEFLEDARERELEIAAAEARLVQLHDSACPHCAFPVEKSFLRCPSCLKRLKEPCVNCRKPLDPRWKICPYCEAEVGQAAPQRRRRRAPAGPAPATGAQRPGAPTQQAPPRAQGAAEAGDGVTRVRPAPEGSAPVEQPAVPRPRPTTS